MKDKKSVEYVPLVSIIIPAYNVEKYLQGVVDSILQQSFSNYEIIIVDDGSQKPCHDLCDEIEKVDSRIKVIHKVNGGVSTARNAGIKVAKGEYLYFLDGDDRLVENVLSNINVLIGVERPDVIACNVHFYTNWEKSYVREEKLNITDGMNLEDLKYELANNAYLAHNFYLREFVLQNNCYFDDYFYTGQDRLWKLYSMCKIQSAIIYDGAFFYHYERRPGSIRNKFKEEKNAELFLLQLKLGKKLFELCDDWINETNKNKLKKTMSGWFWRKAAAIVKNVKNKNVLSEGIRLFKENLYIVKGEWCTIHKYVFLTKILGIKNFLRLMYNLDKKKSK